MRIELPIDSKKNSNNNVCTYKKRFLCQAHSKIRPLPFPYKLWGVSETVEVLSTIMYFFFLPPPPRILIKCADSIVTNYVVEFRAIDYFEMMRNSK